jgi:hypothetical protein
LILIEHISHMRSQIHNVTGQDKDGVVEPLSEERSESYVSISDLDQEIAGLTASGKFLHLTDGDGGAPGGQERLELCLADASNVSSSRWIFEGPQPQRTATLTRTMTSAGPHQRGATGHVAP